MTLRPPLPQVRVAGFAPTFSLTDSGIHRPKIVHCLGDDGRRYKQLVKGHDDLRQDAVGRGPVLSSRGRRG